MLGGIGEGQTLRIIGEDTFRCKGGRRGARKLWRLWCGRRAGGQMAPVESDHFFAGAGTGG